MSGVTRAQWEKAQAAHNALDAELSHFDNTLSLKYGAMHRTWASSAEKKKLEKYRERIGKIEDRIYGYLDKMTNRSWREGVPTHWVCSSLTYDDATKPAGVALSVVPPTAYGHARPIT